MPAKPKQRSVGNTKKYYQPPTVMDKVRRRLADGVPTPKLLHYLHDRDELPKAILDIAEAAESLDKVCELFESVNESAAFDGVSDAVKNANVRDILDLANGGAGSVISKFMHEARKALVLLTMKEPEI